VAAQASGRLGSVRARQLSARIKLSASPTEGLSVCDESLLMVMPCIDNFIIHGIHCKILTVCFNFQVFGDLAKQG
jgi:hypothetical protein